MAKFTIEGRQTIIKEVEADSIEEALRIAEETDFDIFFDTIDMDVTFRNIEDEALPEMTAQILEDIGTVTCDGLDDAFEAFQESGNDPEHWTLAYNRLEKLTTALGWTDWRITDK